MRPAGTVSVWARAVRTNALRAAWLLSLAVILGAPPAQARRYELDDWVSYTTCRHVTSVAMDDRQVYFGTTGGVLRYDHWQERWDTPLTTSSGLPDNHILDVAVAEGGHEVVIYTRRGSCRFDPGLESIYIGGHFPPPPSGPDVQYPDLYPDFELNYYRDEGGAYLTDPYLRRYPLTARLTDGWGNLWIGTAGLGPGRASLRTGRLEMFSYGLLSENVTALAVDGNDIWIGGVQPWDTDAGITRAGPGLQSWDHFEARHTDGFRSGDVTAFARLGEDLWVGTLYGLSRYDEDQDDWITLTTFEGLADDWVTDVAPDRDALWVGTSRGASVVTLRGDSVVVASIPIIGRQKVHDIEAGPEFIWFGTDNGVYALDKPLDRWLKFTSPDGTIDRTVTAISVFDDEVWFATTVGLTLYQRGSEQWRWHPLHGQLHAGHIICLEVDEKAVWAGSESGLWKLRRRTGHWRVFTTEDGLLDNMVQAMVLDGDHIWLGTPGGLTRFFWNNPLRIE
jgi:ligand-binding sensor domain-containing protein